MEERTHTNNSPLVVENHAFTTQRMATSLHHLRNLGIERVRKAHMSHHALLKEGKRSNSLRPIDNLVRNYEISRLDMFLQAADSAEGNDAADSEMAQSGDVGLVGNLVGG